VEALTPDGAARFRRQADIDVGGDVGGAEAAARALGLRLGEAVRAEGGSALEL
jgi:hydroxymethylbilane synthase